MSVNFKPVLLLASSISISISGQASAEYKNNYTDPALSPLVNKLDKEGQRNEVLNRMRIASTAFKRGYYEVAKREFELARVQIEALYTDSPQAKQARSLWYEEGRKDFKGEPYERAMVYFYIGLLAILDGQYDYAHAAFKNGIIQDSFAEEEQHIGDFAIFYFLAIWCAQKMGSEHLIRDYKYRERLKALRADLKQPSNKDDTLVIALTGKSPRKLNDGVGGWQMVYRPGKKMKTFGVKADLGKGKKNIPLIDDVYFQATTRGGRLVDKIIEGQVSFKQNTENFGSTLSSASNNILLQAVALNNSNYGDLAAVGALGVIAQIFSTNVKTKADTRYWDGLPNGIHATSLSQTSTKPKIAFDYLDKQGNIIKERSGETELFVNPKGHKIAILMSDQTN